MSERYYGTLNERGWTNRVESKDLGISMRFIREWKVEEDQLVTPFDVEAFRMALARHHQPWPEDPNAPTVLKQHS